jgi:uncharacterized SAM-binding protein YcdF (DUF218 family)
MVLSKLLPLAVYPLGLIIELLLLAIVLIRFKKHRAAAVSLGIAAFIALFFSSQIGANALTRNFERKYLPVDEKSVKADAIVVLGGCCKPKMFPRNHVEFSEGVERILEGIRFYRAGAAPVVIPTGGGIDFILKGQREGDDMREALVEFGVPDSAVLVERESRNTYENALFTKKLMQERHLGLRIILVTSAMHMVRSVPIFKRAGFTVIPAPCDYQAEDGNVNWYALVPRAECLFLSTMVIKERIGIIIYKLLGWL